MSSIVLNALRRKALCRFRTFIVQPRPTVLVSREFRENGGLGNSYVGQRKHMREEFSLLEATHHDADRFGTLLPQVDEPETPDEGDLREEEFLQKRTLQRQRFSVRQYADMIKDHLTNNRIQEAIGVVEVVMKNDRVKPSNYHFNLLIGGCSRVGYSKKAFQLYNKMKQHGLKVTGGTYTSLFNACAMSPFPADGLKRSNQLREVMLETGYDPNATNYNAMIKAYGRCGDLKTAFQLVDEMMSRQLPIATDTFNFLLQACISDHEHGFRHALLVWHRMHRMQVTPNRYSFNLLLRCVRDCHMGPIETMEECIEQILSNSIESPGSEMITRSEKSTMDDTLDNKVAEPMAIQTNIIKRLQSEGVPDLLSPNPHLGNLVKLAEVRKPEDRLLLLGGFAKVLSEMVKCGVEPDIRTMTELLDVIPPTYVAEKHILTMIKQLKLRCDIDFFNILIKKRSMRFDYECAKDVLHMIEAANLEPDIVTYGVLALGCQTQDEARSLLKMMHEVDVRVNIQILGAMLRQGCARRNFRYITEILNIVKRERLMPNEQFLRHLEEFTKVCEKQDREYDSKPNKKDREEFKTEYNRYRIHLEAWREHKGLHGLALNQALGIVRSHPWAQFKEPQAAGYEEVKNPKLRHKKKKLHYIQKIDLDAISNGEEKNNAETKKRLIS
ncbi:pentatricopeptide repeat-containing protein 1, mitochondrial [Anopheles bellator]|uniref:pentatricopeptide repeat-containing protein 1, mitochondrial n=1 Tax=Anopheles bellator TaxID=139047 RepID=UPI002648C823|nr:pentatricopeptide repeat-containing protein 1, mitochondrial [Anopheles bellator]